MMVQLDATTFVRADTVLSIAEAFEDGVIVFTNDGRKHHVRLAYACQPVKTLAAHLAHVVNKGLKP